MRLEIETFFWFWFCLLFETAQKWIYDQVIFIRALCCQIFQHMNPTKTYARCPPARSLIEKGFRPQYHLFTKSYVRHTRSPTDDLHSWFICLLFNVLEIAHGWTPKRHTSSRNQMCCAQSCSSVMAPKRLFRCRWCESLRDFFFGWNWGRSGVRWGGYGRR